MPGGDGWSRVGSRGHSPLTEGGRGRSGILGLYRVWDGFVRLMVNEPRGVGESYRVRRQVWPKMGEQGLY